MNDPRRRYAATDGILIDVLVSNLLAGILTRILLFMVYWESDTRVDVENYTRISLWGWLGAWSVLFFVMRFWRSKREVRLSRFIENGADQS